MRITNKMLSNNFLADMTTNLRNLKTLQQQMTSGKEISKPSDNPFKVARAMQLHTDIDTNKQYNEDIKDTINWLDTTDTALDQVGDVVHRIRELLISSGNAGYSQNERNANKDEINEKIGELGQILNTTFDGKYIFGGTRGTTKPVDVIGGSSTGTSSLTNNIIIDKSKPSKVGNIVDKYGKLKNDLKFEIKFDEFTKNPNGSLSTTTVTKTFSVELKSGTEIKDLSDLSQKINNEIAKEPEIADKIKSVPNIKDNNIMFVNINEDDNTIKDNTFNLKTVQGDVSITKAESVFNYNNTQNARLMYYKKGGGELVDGNEYSQIKSKLTVQISEGVKMDYNVSASDVLEFKNGEGNSLDLREILNNITNHLDGKNDEGTVVDSDAVKKLVNGDLEKLTDVMDNVLKIRSEVGAKQNRMDSAKTKNTDANFNMTEILSKTEDIDVTEKTMEFATLQNVYLASLSLSAKIIQPTLMDYLR